MGEWPRVPRARIVQIPPDAYGNLGMIAQRQLGRQGPKVGCLGYGAMVLEGYYGQSDDSQAIQTIHRALDVGMTMIDTADAYGNGHNESLVSRAVADRRDRVLIASKFGIVFDPGNPAGPGNELPTGWGFSLQINGRPEYVRHALDASLNRLGVETIDLWYAHYPDPGVPIEETFGAMAEAVRQGKVRHLGLSNVTADQVQRASLVHPIAAVQYEYSLWRREAERELLPTLRNLGVALVAWSPLGAGFLTGKVQEISKDDFRQSNPRMAGSNLAENLDRFGPLMDLALELNITPAQLALAWLLHQGPDVVPIPGTRKPQRVEENALAAEVKLSADMLKRINQIAPRGLAQGATLV